MLRMNFSPAQRVAHGLFASMKDKDGIQLVANQRVATLLGRDDVVGPDVVATNAGRNVPVLVVDSVEPGEEQLARDVKRSGGFVFAVSDGGAAERSILDTLDGSFGSAEGFNAFWKEVGREVSATRVRFDAVLSNAGKGQVLAPVGSGFAL